MILAKKFIFWELSFIVALAIAGCTALRFSIFYYVYAILFLAIPLFVLFKKSSWQFLILLLIFFIFAFWRWQIYEGNIKIKEENFQKIIGQEGVWQIEILQTQKIKNYQKVTAKLFFPEEKPSGKVLAYFPAISLYQSGENLRIKGVLESPPVFDDFNYRDFLKYRGIFAVIKDAEVINKLPPSNFLGRINFFLSSAKSKMMEMEKIVFREPAGSLAAALIFGSANLSKVWLDKFSTTGIIHIVSVSGFHMTVIIAFILALFFRIGFSRKKIFIFVSLVIFFYLLILNFPPAAVRSALMAMLVFWAYILGRLSSAVYLLIFAAFAMLLFQPQLLLHDISFQFSFVATLGLITLFPYLEGKLSFLPNPFKLRSITLLTLSAQIFTLPLSLVYFEKFSLIAPLANFLTIPFAPFLMLAGSLAGILGFIYLPLAKIVLYPFWFLFLIFFKVTDFLSAIPYAQVQFKLNILGLIVYYLILFVLLVCLSRIFPLKNKNTI